MDSHQIAEPHSAVNVSNSRLILAVFIAAIFTSAFLLFAVQSRGTGNVGRLFGPVICAWFTILGLLGLGAIVRSPEVLAAVDPRHAVDFVSRFGWHTLISLGSVFLAVTGAEALAIIASRS